MSNVKITVLDPIWINVDREANQVVNNVSVNNLLKVKVYDGTPLSPDVYDIVLLEGGETITLPTNPVNGEKYTFYVIDLMFIPVPTPSIIINPSPNAMNTYYGPFALATYVFSPVIGSTITYCYLSHVNNWLIL